MNIQASINKLLLALKQKGVQVRYESNTAYSNKSNKFTTNYTIYELENAKWKYKWGGYGKINLLKYLANYYKEVIDNETI